MSIRDVLERRRRALLVFDGCAFIALMLGVQFSVKLGIPWLRYLAAAVFLAAIPLNRLLLRCPRCRGSIGAAKEKPRKMLAPFLPGQLCPYCGVSLEAPWEKFP
jgi:hypothetical protein